MPSVLGIHPKYRLKHQKDQAAQLISSIFFGTPGGFAGSTITEDH
jgi:hypothetical protein